jgi:ribosomal protein S18 acetylase RimI-like enzyme
MEDIRIEPVQTNDIPEIRRLAREIWSVCYRDVISKEQIDYMQGWMYGIETLTDELSSDISYDKIVLNKKTIGFASYGPSEKEGKMKLHKLYIHHNFQNKGFGSKVLSHVLKRAKEEGFKSVVLNVNKENKKAIAAYKKNGFVIAESGKFDIGNGFFMDDHIMEKTL